MLLRDLPKNSIADKTVHPFPWLFGREAQGDLDAIALLDTEVGDRFVFNGGTLVYVRSSGTWDSVAELPRRDSPRGRTHIRNRGLAVKALDADWVGGDAEALALVAEALQPPAELPNDSFF